MNRRRLLAVGGSVLGVGLSGCLSSGLLGGRPEVRETDSTLDRNLPSPATEGSSESPVTTLVVGDGSDHHQVWVWNETRENRAVSVEIGPSDADQWFQNRYDLGPGDTLAIDLREARKYAITVRDDGREEAVSVPESQFDCNDSATDVVVRKDGIESETISTSMGCGGIW